MPSVLEFRPTFRSAVSRKHLATNIKPGDRGTWTNPNTGSVWPDLEVRYAYKHTGALLVVGCFGRMSRQGNLISELKTVTAADFRVTARAGE